MQKCKLKVCIIISFCQAYGQSSKKQTMNSLRHTSLLVQGKKGRNGPYFSICTHNGFLVFLRYYSSRIMIWEDEMGCNRTVGRHVIIFGYWGTNNTDLFKKKRSPFLALGAPKHLSLAVLEVTVKSVDENLNLFYALHHGPTLKNGDSE